MHAMRSRVLLAGVLALSVPSAATVGAVPRPPVNDTAGMARWMLSQVSWGVIATTSIHLNGTAFGNPISVADGLSDGTPYFYVSMMDESMQDLQANPKATLSLSEASIDCAALKIDPEDPRCTRLSLTGTMVSVADESELKKAKATLFEQHSQMKNWPADHSWQLWKLQIEHIWLIDFFGGAADVPVADYKAVVAPVRGVPAISVHKPSHLKPLFSLKADTARWLVHESTWATLATTSVHLGGIAFANPISVVDGTSDNSTGVPYFLVSTLDTSMQDLQRDPRCTLTLSQAALDCQRKSPLGTLDPEDPRCVRLSLTGTMVNVTDADELAFAKKGLVAAHPEMNDWMAMKSHDFHVMKLQVEKVWLIDFFGGASDIAPNDYFAASGLLHARASYAGNVTYV